MLSVTSRIYRMTFKEQINTNIVVTQSTGPILESPHKNVLGYITSQKKKFVSIF